ncbi:MAG: hypothetical protein RBR71_11405 [Gudongella sp.]|nr:hypothetical protein [Gudongella sp.]
MTSERRLKTGSVMMTAGIRNFLEESEENVIKVLECLERHKMCDWGDLSDDDREVNDAAVDLDMKGKPSDRIMSAYDVGENRIWIVTEWDRSVTTILFPEEY